MNPMPPVHRREPVLDSLRRPKGRELRRKDSMEVSCS